MSGLKCEMCCECDEPTGNAGAGDGSLFLDDGYGPLCDTCHDVLNKGDYAAWCVQQATAKLTIELLGVRKLLKSEVDRADTFQVEIASLKEKVERLRQERDNEQAERIRDASKRISVYTRSIDKLESERDALRKEIKCLEDEWGVADLKAQVKELEKAAISDGRGGFVDGCVNGSEYRRVHEGQRVTLARAEAAEAALVEARDLMKIALKDACCISLLIPESSTSAVDKLKDTAKYIRKVIDCLSAINRAEPEKGENK